MNNETENTRDLITFEEANSSRTVRQKGIASRWWTDFAGHGYFEGVTGFGKTQVAIEAITLSGASVRVVVPKKKLHDQWVERLTEAGITNFEVHVVNTFVQSADNLWLQYWDGILIADECHYYAGKEAEYFPRVLLASAKYRLFLSATLTGDMKQRIQAEGLKQVDYVGMDEALQMHWIAPVREYNYLIDFSEQDQILYDALQEQADKEGKFFNNDRRAAQAYLAEDKARRRGEIINAKIDKIEPMRVGQAARLTKILSQMDKLCQSSNTKLDNARQVLRGLARMDRKVIVFCATIDMCKLLATYVEGGIAYHSLQKAAERREVERRLLEEDFTFIFTPKALEDGFDLPNVSCTFNVSGDSKRGRQVQRTGRSARIVPDMNKTTLVINLVIRNTQEQRWVKMRQRDMFVTTVERLDQLPFGERGYSLEAPVIPVVETTPFFNNLFLTNDDNES